MASLSPADLLMRVDLGEREGSWVPPFGLLEALSDQNAKSANKGRRASLAVVEGATPGAGSEGSLTSQGLGQHPRPQGRLPGHRHRGRYARIGHSFIHSFEYWLSFCCEHLAAKGCVCTDGVHSSLHERVSDCPQAVDTKPGNRPHVTGL